ncbi:hypothetical protein C8R44DRAFT_787296 [Mycena epipterygia]|nr:hypothetical protein C8R44DRAFT_787296 [Mycena epipterygia]
MSSELDDELLELVGGGSSDKEKPRKRHRDPSSSATGKPKKSSKKRKLADSDNDPESEEGDEDELYPLEGKYLNEEDREELLGKTEIEREEILAARLDEMERIRDRKHVDKLRAQQLAGVAAVESDALKRPARATAKDKTKDRTLNALKAKRKAKDEKKRTRGASPKQRSSSPMDMEMSDEDSSDSEDGQISKLDQEDERLFGKLNQPKAAAGAAAKEPVLDQTLSLEVLQKIVLTREALVKHSVSPWFEKIITGAWVRYLIGQDESRRVYRICEIKGLSPATKPYNITPERVMHQVFELKHGRAEKAWQMDRTSNEPPTLDEFKRLADTCKGEKIELPTRKDVDERYKEMQELIARPITETDITDMIARKKQLATPTGGPAPLGVAERSRLQAQRTLAQRRQDYAEVAVIDAQLAAASLLSSSGADGEKGRREDEDDPLARVNQRNRRANMEAVRRAEILDAERKRRERKLGTDAGANGVVDPSARLRTVPRLFESKTPTSRPGTPVVVPPKTGTSPAPVAKAPANGNGNGAPAKTFEAAIIESIEVDLGDF